MSDVQQVFRDHLATAGPLSYPVVIVVLMKTAQLVLISSNPSDWLLDAETKRIGRNGLAQARKVLQSHQVTTLRDTAELAIAA